MNDWISLLTGEISAEEAGPLLSRGAADLHTFIESRPQAEQHVLDILGRRLSGGIDAQTWQVLDTNLAHYLGRDLAYLVGWIAQPDQVSQMQELEKHASAEVMAFLRTVLGLFGPELEDAFRLWNQLPDDWSTIRRDVYYDQLSERHHLKVGIEKYNGEEMVIEGSPDSILGLTRYLILTLRLVGTPDAFSQQNIELFLDEAGQFAQLLSSEEGEVPSELPEYQTTGETA